MPTTVGAAVPPPPGAPRPRPAEPPQRRSPSKGVELPRPGDVLAEKYRVERSLGEGGMGVVVAATHLQLRELVAIKFLHPELAERSDLVARFVREAQAVVRIKSEHVARVMDVGKLPSGAPFLVMELLDGLDLGQLVRKNGPLPVPEAIDYLLQACAAIAEAHRLGIVHRDLKPANLFLTRKADGSPLVKVLDFGISKIQKTEEGQAAQELTLTTGDDVLGSPLYMSPEQIRTPRDVDGRADVWSLGAILHRLLTGRPPFEAETAAAVLAMIVADAPTPLRARRPDAPVELEAVVLRCLERDLSKRFPSVDELARALLPFATPGMSQAATWLYATSQSWPRADPSVDLAALRRAGEASSPSRSGSSGAASVSGARLAPAAATSQPSALAGPDVATGPSGSTRVEAFPAGLQSGTPAPLATPVTPGRPPERSLVVALAVLGVVLLLGAGLTAGLFLGHRAPAPALAASGAARGPTSAETPQLVATGVAPAPGPARPVERPEPSVAPTEPSVAPTQAPLAAPPPRGRPSSAPTTPDRPPVGGHVDPLDGRL
jgi:serine/threonine protein kinase